MINKLEKYVEQILDNFSSNSNFDIDNEDICLPGLKCQIADTLVFYALNVMSNAEASKECWNHKKEYDGRVEAE